MLKKIGLTSLGIALLAAPALSSAQTTSDIQAQIAALLQQVKQLKAQIAALGGGSGAGTVLKTSSKDPREFRMAWAIESNIATEPDVVGAPACWA